MCHERGGVEHCKKFSEHWFHYPSIHPRRTCCWHVFHTFYRELFSTRKKWTFASVGTATGNWKAYVYCTYARRPVFPYPRSFLLITKLRKEDMWDLWASSTWQETGYDTDTMAMMRTNCLWTQKGRAGVLVRCSFRMGTDIEWQKFSFPSFQSAKRV